MNKGFGGQRWLADKYDFIHVDTTHTHTHTHTHTQTHTHTHTYTHTHTHTHTHTTHTPHTHMYKIYIRTLQGGNKLDHTTLIVMVFLMGSCRYVQYRRRENVF